MPEILFWLSFQTRPADKECSWQRFTFDSSVVDLPEAQYQSDIAGFLLCNARLKAVDAPATDPKSGPHLGRRFRGSAGAPPLRGPRASRLRRRERRCGPSSAPRPDLGGVEARGTAHMGPSCRPPGTWPLQARIVLRRGLLARSWAEYGSKRHGAPRRRSPCHSWAFSSPKVRLCRNVGQFAKIETLDHVLELRRARTRPLFQRPAWARVA